MRRLLAAALLATLVVVPTAFGSPHATSQFSGGFFSGEGFDKCTAPSSAAMRSWLASPYRTVNIYLAGNNRACPNQPELIPQWISTVLSNGWSIVPTYVGSQAPCRQNGTIKIPASSATAQGKQEADDAASQMAALGMPPLENNPVYFDMEPYDTSNSNCNNAVMNFFKGWTLELHAQGYVSGIYGTVATVMKQLVQRQTNPNFTQPDAIWYAHYWNVSQTEHDSTTDEDATLGSYWSGHRMHQWVGGGYSETWNGQKFFIDRDRIDGDVVSAVTPAPPSGSAPYHYAAAPPAGTTLKERSAPAKSAPQTLTYPSGADLSIVCQITGDLVQGDSVWDQLSDGNYVSDIFTTTTGGLTFTSGLPQCGGTTEADTTPPSATMTALPTATIDASQAVAWSGTDDSSGVASYDVQWERARWDGGFGGWQQPARWTATTVTAGSLAIAPGYEYCVHVRATDVAGNVGAWSTPTCVARALDDRTLTPTAGWLRQSGSAFYLHTATTAKRSGVQLKLPNAQLKQVGVVATVCSACGSVKVVVGSKVIGTINLQAEGFHNRKVIVLPTTFSRRTRTVHLITTSSAMVRIDGLVVRRL
jgi:hypothetical protein